ncbi:zf-HC2 domain-containing protein [uncultured Tateyamaria sp.]|uniref:zf-HC2 domain-containing protein n=1 Tax=uncultured Tateyamaria sp. TaxID=455651 RepID=UPI00261AA265|nr:zf-HC2 domain-containing protein [uncultured Tateyamaria sp.]
MTNKQAENMQLRDNNSNGPQNDHEEVWDLIPWYVNGTLPDTDIAMVEAHAKTCIACSEEIGRQTVLAQKVVKTDPFDVPLQRSWDTLRAQVEADLRARTPVTPKRGWLEAMQGRGRGMLGGLAIACLALVLVAVQFGGPGQDDFVTLTSEPASDAPTIRFQPAPDLTQAQLADLLTPLGVVAVTGPSAAGIYSATLAQDADVAAVSAAMMAQDQILFAAPEAGQ